MPEEDQELPEIKQFRHHLADRRVVGSPGGQTGYSAFNTASRFKCTMAGQEGCEEWAGGSSLTKTRLFKFDETEPVK